MIGIQLEMIKYVTITAITIDHGGGIGRNVKSFHLAGRISPSPTHPMISITEAIQSLTE